MSDEHWGQLGRGYWFYCGNCSRTQRVDFYSDAANKGTGEEAMRKLGAIKTKDRGWICPSCVNLSDTWSNKRLANWRSRLAALKKQEEYIETELEQQTNPTEDWVKWKQRQLELLNTEVLEVLEYIHKFGG